MTQGQVFVCTNRWCREKGSDATMATFSFLCPQTIPVVSVNCLGRCNKGPNVRILTAEGAFVEAAMVRSVEIVVNLLQTNLNLNVNITSAEVLKLNYEGNVFLRSGEVDSAIDCYNKALDLGDHEQEGVLLVMRGTALLQRAYAYRMRHKELLQLALDVLPYYEGLNQLLGALSPLQIYPRCLVTLDILTNLAAISHQLDLSPRWVDARERWSDGRDTEQIVTAEDLLRRVGFSFAMYEYALSSALEDLLHATIVLPGFAQAWRRAGDALGEFRRFRAAIEYYNVAIRLDEGLTESVVPALERMKLLEKIVDNAEASGWPAEAVLALIED